VHAQWTLGLISHIGFSILGVWLVWFALTRPSHSSLMRWKGDPEPVPVPMYIGMRVFMVLIGGLLAVAEILIAVGVLR
jgi:hypothetical protein